MSLNWTEFDQERNRAWYSDPLRDSRAKCSNCSAFIPSVARTMFNIGFDQGARWAIRRSAQMSPHIAKMVEMLLWLYGDDEDSYNGLYNAARDVWESAGTDSDKLEYLGQILAQVEAKSTLAADRAEALNQP